MSAPDITRVGDTVDRLGEGPVWDHETQCLFWVDSLAGILRRLHPASGARHDVTVPAPIGSFTLTTRGDAILCVLTAIVDVDAVWHVKEVEPRLAA